MNNKYDIIGDIHGNADERHCLLKLLGYKKSEGAYRHKMRQR